jgi:hypothetical protein
LLSAGGALATGVGHPERGQQAPEQDANRVASQAAGVVEVELLQTLAGREPSGPDPTLPAMALKI